jgi:HD-like signal output (HDOD) protein
MSELESLVEALQWFEPFKSMDVNEVVVMATKTQVERLPARHTLFAVGDRDPWLYCLIEGSVELRGRDGRSMEVTAGTPRAVRPLSPMRPRLHAATTLSPVVLARVDVSTLPDLQGLLSHAEYAVQEIAFDSSGIPEQVQLHELTMLSEGLQVPSLPEAALRARQLLEAEDVDLKAIATVVTRDPALSAKLLRAANSAMYRHGRESKTCEEAIARLGTNTARQLITAFATRGLFETEVATIRNRLRRAWERSIEVAAISFVIARLTRTFQPDEALLVGLLYDIGELPIYAYLGRHPSLEANDEFVDQLVSALKVRAGMTIARQWELPPHFSTVIQNAGDWWRDPSPQPDLADLVMVARIHSFIGKPDRPQVPSLLKLPAFKKLAGDAASPRLSAQILEEAATQVAEIRSVLAS